MRRSAPSLRRMAREIEKHNCRINGVRASARKNNKAQVAISPAIVVHKFVPRLPVHLCLCRCLLYPSSRRCFPRVCAHGLRCLPGVRFYGTATIKFSFSCNNLFAIPARPRNGGLAVRTDSGRGRYHLTTELFFFPYLCALTSPNTKGPV